LTIIIDALFQKTQLLMKSEVELPIQYSCHNMISRSGEQFVPAHTLLLLISGSMYIAGLNKSLTLQAGTLCFFEKNNLLKFQKNPVNGQDFRSISIALEQQVLQSFALEYNYRDILPTTPSAFQVLPTNALVENFLNSLLTFEQIFQKEHAAGLLQIKVKEAVLTLMMAYPDLKNILFDFSAPGKLNLTEFMLKNYHFNVNIGRFAQLTGRSLATFKRDFERTFGTSPSKWLIQKRLEEAHYLIKKKHKIASEIYLDLGFEDLSHFSFAFKKRYGVAPSML
jgi:AraC-like DNA-binding protein